MAQLPEAVDHISALIDASYERGDTEARRGYLGASAIGDECERKLWYEFRWAHAPEGFEGRMLRLFQTGHREEERLINYLKRIGVEVDEIDPATGRQFAVSAIGGHFRGHMDGRATNVPGAPVVAHVVECKTHNDKSFKALVKDGVARAKPQHYAQMQAYMHLNGLTRALYIAVNKNDDALHTERVAYDAGFAMQIMAKAERIIAADHAPARLHEDPTSRAAFACNWCAARSICHGGAYAGRSCRTCLHATAVIDGGDRGAWHCARWGRQIKRDAQAQGCPAHAYLPSLVPDEQIDASETPVTVTYRRADGSTWIDGEAS